MDGRQQDSPVSVTTHERPENTLVAGFSTYGLAGLTAVDYLVDHLDLSVTGHVEVPDFPPFTPFEAGTPRHHTRLFSRDDLDVTVLVNELFVPLWASESFSSTLLEWADDADVAEITIPAGVPVPHGPEAHRVFYVATEDYQEASLAGTSLDPMPAGHFDGVQAALLSRGMSSPTRTGVLVTPVHDRIPDVEAAVRLVEALNEVHDLGAETGPLEAFAAEVEQYYRDLSARLEAANQREVPEDRMYM